MQPYIGLLMQGLSQSQPDSPAGAVSPGSGSESAAAAPSADNDADDDEDDNDDSASMVQPSRLKAKSTTGTRLALQDTHIGMTRR